MTSQDITQFDEYERYCRQLGHAVPFHYCRQMATGLPCRHIVGCWREEIEVEPFIREHYTPEQLARIFQPPQEKVATLYDLIEKARRASQEEDAN